jgi:hypothetical protein
MVGIVQSNLKKFWCKKQRKILKGKSYLRKKVIMCRLDVTNGDEAFLLNGIVGLGNNNGVL